MREGRGGTEYQVFPTTDNNYPNIENQKSQLLELLVFDIGIIGFRYWDYWFLKVGIKKRNDCV
jgi:hypothetical protein